MGYIWTPYAVPNPKTHLNYNSIKYRIQNRHKYPLIEVPSNIIIYIKRIGSKKKSAQSIKQ